MSFAVGRVAQLLRGGSWFNEPHNCRSAYRNSNHPANHNDNVGLRLCCLPPAPFTAGAVGWEASGSARGVQTRSRDPRPPGRDPHSAGGVAPRPGALASPAFSRGIAPRNPAPTQIAGSAHGRRQVHQALWET